jgi:hypothetical protein
MPIIFMGNGFRSGTELVVGFGIAFTGSYLGMVPMMGLSMLQYSQQWQAADLFRAAPMIGPASLYDGARRAVLCLLALPVVLALILLVWFLSHRQGWEVLLLLPGMISLPVFAMIPGLGGKGVPLSLPVEEAKSAGRGLVMIGATFGSMAVSGVALLAWSGGWYWWFILVEAVFAAVLYLAMRRSIARSRWSAME